MTVYSVLSPYIPPAISGSFWRLYFGLTPYLGVPISICRMTGPARPNGRTARILVAGRPGWFFRTISNLVFLSPPTVEAIGSAPIWKLRPRLRELRNTADVTLVLADAHNATWLFSGEYLTVPAWVGMHRPAPPAGSLGLDLVSRNLRRDLQRIRSHAYQPLHTRVPSEVAWFYRDYYLPTSYRRHGEDAFVRDERSLRRSHARGGILWIKKGEERVAGALYEQDNGVLQLLAFGLRGGDAALRKRGALVAAYLNLCLQARALGCHSIDFRACRPFLRDGVLCHKKKWGGTLYDRTSLACEEMGIDWPRWNPAVADLLGELSVIFRHRGHLSALSTIDTGQPSSSEEASKLHHQLWLPGLYRLYLVSHRGWQPGAQPPPDCALLDPEQVATAATFLSRCDTGPNRADGAFLPG